MKIQSENFGKSAFRANERAQLPVKRCLFTIGLQHRFSALDGVVALNGYLLLDLYSFRA